MRTAMKLFGIFASLSAFSLMSGVSLAASRPPVHRQTIKANSISTATVQAQEAQTIQIANRYVMYNANGIASVNNTTLHQAGLSSQAIRFVQTEINVYNNKVTNGTIQPATVAPRLLPANSTGGLPYRWYTAHTPYEYTTNHWWGQSYIYNEDGTQHLEGFYLMIAAGAGSAAAASTYLDWSVGGVGVTALLGVTGALTGGVVADMMAADNGFGDHFNEMWNGIPLGWYGNTP